MLRRSYRIFCLLLAAMLAACSTAPTRMSGGGAQSYTRSEHGAPAMPPGLPQFIDHSVGEEEISIEAMSLVGVPYRWGGNTPDSGFDCSGLVDYVVRRAASVNLPRTTEQMESVGTSISPDEISPGDLIFFNTTGRPHSHVGIYVGQYRFVNAPSTGGTVRIDYVTNPYWAKRFDGIRRVASAGARGRPFEATPIEAEAPSPSLQQTAVVKQPDADAAENAGRQYISRQLPETVHAMPIDTRTETQANVGSNTPSDAQSNTQSDKQFDTQAAAQSSPSANNRSDIASSASTDPIAEIANLSGAGEVKSTPRQAEAPSAPPPTSTPKAAPAYDTQTTDPIAGFADSSNQ